MIKVLLLGILLQLPMGGVTAPTATPVVTLATSNGATSSSVTLAGVAAGDLVACSYQNDTLSSSQTVSDGTSTLTSLAQFNSGSAAGSQMYYILSSVASGTVTYTNSLAGGIMSCWDFHVTGGKTWVFDAFSQGGAGGGAIATTGNITTTGTLEAVIMGSKIKNIGATINSATINGVAATVPSWSGTLGGHYYQIPTSTFTGQGQVNYSNGTNWVIGIAAFKAH